ncbi:hypothetical protein ROZALSC1DRAFT_18678, partial [Rozella allomycis CSF55]
MPKISEPEYFYGNPKKLAAFLRQLEFVFELNEQMYNTDNKRIIYAASYCRGPVCNWLE